MGLPTLLFVFVLGLGKQRIVVGPKGLIEFIDVLLQQSPLSFLEIKDTWVMYKSPVVFPLTSVVSLDETKYLTGRRLDTGSGMPIISSITGCDKESWGLEVKDRVVVANPHVARRYTIYNKYIAWVCMDRLWHGSLTETGIIGEEDWKEKGRRPTFFFPLDEKCFQTPTPLSHGSPTHLFVSCQLHRQYTPVHGSVKL